MNSNNDISYNCYYGNISNILVNRGEKISEAELILLSETLNCEIKLDSNLFFGFNNDDVFKGLKKIGYLFQALNSDTVSYQELLSMKIPVLLLVNACILNYNSVFLHSRRKHYIVMLEDNGDQIKIIDSFIHTIPVSSFTGNIDKQKIFEEIKSGRAHGFILKKENSINLEYSIIDEIKKHINLSYSSEKGCLKKLERFCDLAIENKKQIFNKHSMSELAYTLRVCGAISRFKILGELLGTYFPSTYRYIDEINNLEKSWQILCNNLIKCSLTLDERTFDRIFKDTIFSLILKEKELYKNIIILMNTV